MRRKVSEAEPGDYIVWGRPQREPGHGGTTHCVPYILVHRGREQGLHWGVSYITDNDGDTCRSMSCKPKDVDRYWSYANSHEWEEQIAEGRRTQEQFDAAIKAGKVDDLGVLELKCA